MTQDAVLSKLLPLYIDATRAHGDATEAGDYETANECADRISTLHKRIRDRGDEGANALRSLLNHDNLGVRNWAALHCLSFAPLEAEATLAKIATVKGSLVSLSAQITLDEWRKRNLRCDTKRDL